MEGLLARIAVLEVEVAALKKAVASVANHVRDMSSSPYVKGLLKNLANSLVPSVPETQAPKDGSVWDGSERPGCPTKR